MRLRGVSTRLRGLSMLINRRRHRINRGRHRINRGHRHELDRQYRLTDDTYGMAILSKI
jgi:hypothetical protein